ncbi:hypothetical protein, partial [Streptomyces abyssalis]
MVQHGNTQHGGEYEGRGPDAEPGGRRPLQLVVGGRLLTVNPVDGSEVESCPPTELPGEPRRLTHRERAVHERGTAGATEGEAPASPVQGGAASGSPGAPGRRGIPMLERDEERERLAGQLARGRSVRLTGLPGSGRTTLLDAVAADVADLAPDGVVRLNGYRRTSSDLLQELFAAVHDAPRHRPGDEEIRAALQGVGAVVIVDDLGFGGEALDQLLGATPECAFLLAVTPDVAPPSGDVHVEEFRLTGLSRTACLELLEHAVRRPLTNEETDAAQDMWFASEESSGGLPLRFVQAGALLRYGGRAGELSGSRGSAMGARVAERLSSAARDALRFALSLGGELPHHTQLPALVGDPRADEAEGELARAGLVTAAGGHYKLAAGVADALSSAGFAEGTDGRALMAAHHYGWWVGHQSVTSTRVAAEADVVLAALHGAQRGGQASAAVLLARSAAPVLAGSLRWSAWDKVLRGGLEAARISGEVAQEAYFHHELGVLALCTEQLPRAVAELEASIALRGALADQQGTLTGRRALALATDLLVAQHPAAPVGPPEPGGQERPEGRPAQPAPGATPSVPGAAAASLGAHAGAEAAAYEDGDRPTRSLAASLRGHRRGEQRDGGDSARTVAASLANPNAGAAGGGVDTTPTLVHPAHGSVAYGARRNLAAAGAGAVLIAVLATIVGLGRMPDDGSGPLDRGKPGSTSHRDDHSDVNAEEPDSRSPRTGESSKSGSPSESEKSPDASDSASKESPSESSSEPDEDPSSSEPGDAGGSGGSPTGSPGNSGGSDSGGTDDGGTDNGGTDDGGTDNGGTDDGGTDNGGTDDGGTD